MVAQKNLMLLMRKALMLKVWKYNFWELYALLASNTNMLTLIPRRILFNWAS
jgi:hypothetical protein